MGRMGSRSGLLLMSGLHANESTTRQIVEKVTAELVALGQDNVQHFHVPYDVTLLACVDSPEEADTTYCLPTPHGNVDYDLEALVGDRVLRERFPGLLQFEFHNARDIWKRFRVNPDKPIEEYEVGEVMPVFTRPYEIGTWRNVLPDGTSGKYVIEVPAVFRPIPDNLRKARLAQVEQLRNEGYGLDHDVVDLYLMTEVDLAETRDRGLIGPVMVNKIVSWILSRLDAENDMQTEDQSEDQ